jgi:carbonic anhydrase
MAAQFLPCVCCRVPMLPPGLDRRHLLLGATAAGLTLASRIARAQGTAVPSSTPYKAMLLSCVDPRTQAPIADWMNKPVSESHASSLQGKYSQFTIAGAAVGVVAPYFSDAWRETFWDNFSATIQLHRIENLIVVDHSNCGAVGLAYGVDVLNDPKLELDAHMDDVTELKRQLSIRHPDAGFQAWYVARDSAGTFTEWKNLIPGPVIA